jgi:hypothetical protein
MTNARGEHDNPAPTRPGTGRVWLSAARAAARVSTIRVACSAGCGGCDDARASSARPMSDVPLRGLTKR